MEQIMTPDEWEASLPAIDQWMLRIYRLSIVFNEGGVQKNKRREVRELLNWSLSRQVYNVDHARGLYVQWLDRLELVEDQPSV
jgi:hypothetical protein